MGWGRGGRRASAALALALALALGAAGRAAAQRSGYDADYDYDYEDEDYALVPAPRKGDDDAPSPPENNRGGGRAGNRGGDRAGDDERRGCRNSRNRRNCRNRKKDDEEEESEDEDEEVEVEVPPPPPASTMQDGSPAVPASWFSEGVPAGQEYLLNAIAQSQMPGAPQFFDGALNIAPRPAGGAQALRRSDLWDSWYSPYGDQPAPSNVRALPAQGPDGGVLAWDACRSPADVFTVLCGEPGQPRGTAPTLFVEVRGTQCYQDSFSVQLDGLRPGATYECAVAASSVQGNSTVSTAAYLTAGFTPAITREEGSDLVWSHRNEDWGGQMSDWDLAARSPATAQEVATGELLEQATTALGSLCPPLPYGPQTPPQNLQVKMGAASNTLELSWYYCTDLAESFDVSCQALGPGVRSAGGGGVVPPARQTLGALCWQKELEFSLSLPPLAPESAGSPWGCEVRARGPRGESGPARATSFDEGSFDPTAFQEAGVHYCTFEEARAASLDSGELYFDVPMGTEGITEVSLPGESLAVPPVVGAGGFNSDSRIAVDTERQADWVVQVVDLGSPSPPPGAEGSCSDEPPPGSQHSCEDQRSWGKCGENFLRGYCSSVCGRC